MSNKISSILELIENKASIKQDTYKCAIALLEGFKKQALELVEKLKQKNKDKRVLIELKEINEFEFHIIVGGDLLAFMLQTNVFTLPFDEKSLASPYFKKNPEHLYFGQLFVYNFMADSVKYQRKNDLGYLISRISVNNDNHFFLEGIKNLNFIFPDVSKNTVTEEFIENLLEELVVFAIETDLVASSYGDNFELSVEQNLFNSPRNNTNKLGFQMGGQNNKIN